MKTSAKRIRRPRCQCGRICAYYGPVGGYSVKCEKCNAKNAERQRRARAFKKGEIHDRTKDELHGVTASPNRAEAIAALLDVAAYLTDSERGMAADSLRDYARIKRSKAR